MPVEAEMYVQVPDTTTNDDWDRWRTMFLANHGLGPDTYSKDFQIKIESELFEPEWFWHREFNFPEDMDDIFSQSVFLKVILPGRSYYGPGYERGDLLEFIEHAEWIEKNVPQSQIWYMDDGGGGALIFNTAARQILRSYYEKVGSLPYDSKREDKEVWREVQDACWAAWLSEQARVLGAVRDEQKVRDEDGI
jgi:hypothetical protein